MQSIKTLKKIIQIVPAIIVLISSAVPAQASKTLWSINKEHSIVQFKIKNMMVKTVSGQFNSFFGTVDYDGCNLDRALINAEIHLDSVDTKNKKRDEHLLTKDFFDVPVYPTMTYKSNRIVVGPNGDFRIFGTLSLHGVSRSVTLNASAPKEIEGDKSKTSCRAKLMTVATASFDRKDFDISMGPMDKGGTMVGDMVQIYLQIQLDPAN